MADIPHGYEHFYQDPTFWVGVSFTLVIVFLAKPIFKAVHSLLGNKIDKIKNSIDDAKKLEQDAKELMKEYQEKLANLDKEIKDILDKSKAEIEFQKNSKLQELEADLKHRKADTASFLQNLQEQAQKEVQEIISDRAINKIKESALKNLSQKTQDTLIDSSINQITKLK